MTASKHMNITILSVPKMAEIIMPQNPLERGNGIVYRETVSMQRDSHISITIPIQDLLWNFCSSAEIMGMKKVDCKNFVSLKER